MRMICHRFPRHIRQNVEILEGCGLETVNVDRSDRLERRFRIYTDVNCTDPLPAFLRPYLPSRSSARTKTIDRRVI